MNALGYLVAWALGTQTTIVFGAILVARHDRKLRRLR
jgi:hypothetical protein